MEFHVQTEVLFVRSILFPCSQQGCGGSLDPKGGDVIDVSGNNSVFDIVDSPVFVVTTAFRQERSGMIATWIVQGSLVEKPGRLVAVFSPKNKTTELLLQSREFVVHLLAEDQLDLVPKFGLFSSRDVDKFQDILLQSRHESLPFIDQTCGWMKCTFSFSPWRCNKTLKASYQRKTFGSRSSK